MACISDAVLISRTSSFSSSIFHELFNLRTDFTDFQLRTGDTRVNCHRLVIAANSPVLKQMLKSPMRESAKGHVLLNSISPRILDILIEYMYCGEVIIPKKRITYMLQAADYLQMYELRRLCLEQFPTVVCTDNVISWFKIAGKLNLQNILCKCSDMMISKLSGISDSQEFLMLTYEELTSYFHDLKEVNPDILLDTSLKWVNYDPENRQGVVKDLLLIISLEKCSLKCIKTMKQKYELLFEFNKMLMEYLGEGQVQCAVTEKPVKKTTVSLGTTKKPDMASAIPHALVVGGYDNDQYWQLDTQPSLSNYCQIPKEHHQEYSSFCSTPEGFVVSGGHKSDDCVLFKLKAKTWQKLTKLSKKRGFHASVVIQGVLFVIGGVTKNRYGHWSKSVQYIDLEGGRWHDGPAIPERVKYPEVVSMGQNVYLFNPENNRLFMLAAESQSWVAKSSLLGARCDGARMIQVRDLLCVVGGYNTHAFYTPSTDTWFLSAAKPTLRHAHGALVHLNNTLFVLGGHDQKKVDIADIVAFSVNLPNRALISELDIRPNNP